MLPEANLDECGYADDEGGQKAATGTYLDGEHSVDVVVLSQPSSVVSARGLDHLSHQGVRNHDPIRRGEKRELGAGRHGN